MNHNYTLKKNQEIEKIVKLHQSVGNKYYAIYYKTSNETKVAISVSKKLGTAVFRNYQKRVMREILRMNFDLLKNKEILIVVKVNSVALSFEQRNKEITKLLELINRKVNI